MLIFPIWLGGAPAYMRAFLEQIARASFVAEMENRGIRQKLKAKSVRIIVTMGNIMHGVLGLGGIAPINLTMFGAVENAKAGVQKRRLTRVLAWDAMAPDLALKEMKSGLCMR